MYQDGIKGFIERQNNWIDEQFTKKMKVQGGREFKKATFENQGISNNDKKEVL